MSLKDLSILALLFDVKWKNLQDYKNSWAAIVYQVETNKTLLLKERRPMVDRKHMVCNSSQFGLDLLP